MNENETSKSVNKNFFSDVFYNIKEFFSKVKTKIEKFKLEVHGVKKYKIIKSGNLNCCEHCQEMAEKIYNVDELLYK